MRTEQVKDILEHTRHFHELISDFYQNLSQNTDKERLKIILDYLSEHELHLEKAFAEYEKTASKKILNVWLPFSPCQERLTEFKVQIQSEEITIKEIIQKVIELDDCVINMYRDLVSQADNQDVKDVFYSILDFETHEKRVAMRDLVWMEDL